MLNYFCPHTPLRAADFYQTPFFTSTPNAGSPRVVLYRGSQTVLCFEGESLGVHENETYWEKDDSKISILNSSVECPNCISCENIEQLLTLTSISNSEGHYWAHVLPVSYYPRIPKEYHECIEVSNRFVSFLVINGVNEGDIGSFSFTISSLSSRSRKTTFNTLLGKLAILKFCTASRLCSYNSIIITLRPAFIVAIYSIPKKHKPMRLCNTDTIESGL